MDTYESKVQNMVTDGTDFRAMFTSHVKFLKVVLDGYKGGTKT